MAARVVRVLSRNERWTIVDVCAVGGGRGRHGCKGRREMSRVES